MTLRFLSQAECERLSEFPPEILDGAGDRLSGYNKVQRLLQEKTMGNNDFNNQIETLRRRADELQQYAAEDLTQLKMALPEVCRELQNVLNEMQTTQQMVEAEHRQIEKVLQASEERYKQLLEAVTDYVYSVKVEQGQAVATRHGSGCFAITGFTSQEYETDPNLWYQMIYEEDRAAVVDQAARILAGKEVDPIEHRLIHKDGTVRWVRNTPVPQYDEEGGLVAYDGLISDITERKLAEIESKRLLESEHEQRLLAETLGEVFLALTSQTSHEAVLNEILYQAQRIVPHSAANIVLLKNNTLYIARWRGYETFGSEQVLASLEQSLVHLPLDAEVVESGRPLVIRDTGQNPQWVTVPELAWIKSFVAIPICLHGWVLGLLRLDSEIPEKFSARDVERLLPLANAAAIALENARLYYQMQEKIAEQIQAEVEIMQHNQKLLALQSAGTAITSSLDLPDVLNRVAREMANILGVQGCAIFEWNQAANEISVVAEHGLSHLWVERSLDSTYNQADFPLTKWTLAERHTHLTDFPLATKVLLERRAQQMIVSQPDLGPVELAYMQAIKIKTLLMLPMEFQNRMVGMAGLMDYRTERIFSYEEIALAQLLANQAASAIENAYLYLQARRELAERVQAENELRRIALRNQAILEAIPDSMFYFSRAGELLIYKVAHHSGLPLGILGETIVGQKLHDLLPPDLVNPILQYINQTLDSGVMQAFEYQLSLPEGPQDFEARLVVSGPNEVLAIVRNITKRKQMEEALKKSETYLAASEARLQAEMQSVLIITHALVSEINLNNLLEFIMVQAEHLMNADGAAVLLLSDDGQQLEVATPGESWLRMKPGSRFHIKGSLAELALVSQQVQISNRAQDDDLTASILPLLPSFACQSLLCAPLIIQGKNLGVLLIWSEHVGVFSNQDSYLMSLFSNQAALALENAHLHAQNQQLAIKQERHRLARELHDSVTQSLYSMGLAAQAALKLLRQNLNSEVRYPLEHIHTLSQIALTEMREQLYDLHPIVLQEGLVKALTQHCNMLSRHYSLEIEFKADLDSSLSVSQRDTLYYLAKEALWNIVKHANATHINIVMSSKNDQIVVSIEDDGVGFDPSAFTEGETMGLRNMKERTKLLGGTFELQSKLGQGTGLTVRIPVGSHE